MFCSHAIDIGLGGSRGFGTQAESSFDLFLHGSWFTDLGHRRHSQLWQALRIVFWSPEHDIR